MASGNNQGNPTNAIPVYLGGPVVPSLLDNASATGDPVTVTVGGSYILAVAGTFGSTSAQLQALGPDGTTWIDVGTAMTGADQQGVVLGQGAVVRMELTGGAPSAMYATLS